MPLNDGRPQMRRPMIFHHTLSDYNADDPTPFGAQVNILTTDEVSEPIEVDVADGESYRRQQADVYEQILRLHYPEGMAGRVRNPFWTDTSIFDDDEPNKKTDDWYIPEKGAT